MLDTSKYIQDINEPTAANSGKQGIVTQAQNFQRNLKAEEKLIYDINKHIPKIFGIPQNTFIAIVIISIVFIIIFYFIFKRKK